MGLLIQLDIVFTWLTFPKKLHPYALRNHANTLREIRILHTGGYWLKFAELSTRDVGLLLYSRGHFIIIKYNLLFRKKESLYSNSTWVELTWWRFLEMGSSSGGNRRSRACYATARLFGYRSQFGRRSRLPSRRVVLRCVASRIVWTVLLISLEPNHAT